MKEQKILSESWFIGVYIEKHTKNKKKHIDDIFRWIDLNSYELTLFFFFSKAKFSSANWIGF